MKRIFIAMLVIPIVMLSGLSASASDDEEKATPKEQKRRLIYCADHMTHEEREAYRAGMRAAGSREERENLRQTHRKKMQDRVRESGKDPRVCEPDHYRLRYRGGKHESAS